MVADPMPVHHHFLYSLRSTFFKGYHQSPIRRFRRFPQIIQTEKGICESRLSPFPPPLDSIPLSIYIQSSPFDIKNRLKFWALSSL